MFAVLYRNKPSSQNVTGLGYKELQHFVIRNILILWSQYFIAIRQIAQVCNIAFQKSGTVKQNLVYLHLMAVKINF